MPVRDGYAFRHALLAEAVYDDLLPGRAGALAHGVRRSPVRAGLRARRRPSWPHHARAAHDRPVALRASIQAGDEAMSVGGPDEAATHYEAALELMTEIGDPDGQPAATAAGGLQTWSTWPSRPPRRPLAAGRVHRALALVQDQLAVLPEPTPPPVQRARLLLRHRERRPAQRHRRSTCSS